MKSGSLNISGMPYRRSGHAGGKSVSMISMLAFLMAALLVLPSCFDDDTETVTVKETETVTKYFCPDGTEAESAADCEDDTTEDPAMCDGTSFPGETLMGGDPNDVLCGLETNDTIIGGGGDDTITGGAGNDTIHGGEGADEIKGEAGNDKLYGDAGGDKIYGGDDDDEITGGGGSNMLDGGDGVDIAIYKDSDRVSVNLKTGVAVHIPADVTFVNRGGEDSLANIENVKGSHGNDVINGDDGPNLLKGLDGMDTINGHGGDDTILPNRPAGVMGAANAADADATEVDGADTVNGGAGNDTISYEGEAEAVTIDLSNSNIVQADTTATPPVAAHVAVTIASVTAIDMIAVDDKGTEDTEDDVSTIENIVGGTNNDELTGDSRNNTLKGLAGGDTLTGGPGDDILDGGAGADQLMGGFGNDMIYADNDDSTIDGGIGLSATDDKATAIDETMDGDTDTVSYANIKATKDGKTGFVQKTLGTELTNIEVLIGSPNNDILGGDGTANTINGGPGEDEITTGAGDDVIVVFSGEGPDTVTDWGLANPGANMKGDEIHLKNFASSTPVVKIATATNVTVSVGNTVVLNIEAGGSNAAPEAIEKDLNSPGKIKFVTTN